MQQLNRKTNNPTHNETPPPPRGFSIGGIHNNTTPTNNPTNNPTIPQQPNTNSIPPPHPNQQPNREQPTTTNTPTTNNQTLHQQQPNRETNNNQINNNQTKQPTTKQGNKPNKQPTQHHNTTNQQTHPPIPIQPLYRDSGITMIYHSINKQTSYRKDMTPLKVVRF